MALMFRDRFWAVMTGLAMLSGVVYTSWPLGYWLNPMIVRRGLASELAGAGQPYNWLFSAGDIVSGLIMLAVCRQLAAYFRSAKRPAPPTLMAMAVFCAGTIVAALCPEPCIAALRQCPAFTHSFGTLLHALASVAAGFGLFASVGSLWQQRRGSRRLAAQTVLYAILGCWTLATLFNPREGALAQNMFITYSALCLAAYPLSLRHAYKLPLSQKT